MQSLTVSRLILLNRGKATIRGKTEHGSDIVEDIEIVVSEDMQILNVKVLQMSNPRIGFLPILSEDKKSCVLNFHHLHHEDGAVFEVIHTGISSQGLEILGSVTDAKEVRKMSTEEELSRMPPFWSFARRRLPTNAARKAHLIYSPTVALTLSGLLAFFVIREGVTIKPFKIVDVDVFVFGLVVVAIGILIAWREWLKNSRSLFFTSLDLFHERLFQEDTDND